jgi:hypothetical protein
MITKEVEQRALAIHVYENPRSKENFLIYEGE